MKTLIVLLIATLAQTLGNVWLTKGMKTIGEVQTLAPGELLAIGLQVFTHPLIWLGIALLLVFFALYLVALSWADLSYVVPTTAFGYVLSAFLSWQLLGERVSLTRWAGTLLICAGVALVSRTEQRTTAPAARAGER
jgi:drug/metabolite transporter (DMT)-like permease